MGIYGFHGGSYTEMNARGRFNPRYRFYGDVWIVIAIPFILITKYPA
jgi:hypothetical protein